MQKVVVDTGPLVALFDAGDAHHAAALQFVRRSKSQLVSSLAVVTEAMYLLQDDMPCQQDLLAWLHGGGLHFAEPEAEDYQRIGRLMEKYADLPMDFADAVVVTLCERLETNLVATVDQDFTVYRYGRHGRFRNVFFE